MFTLPILTFYLIDSVLGDTDTYMGLPKSNWSVMGSVMVVNGVIGAYVWMAFNEDDDEDEEGGGRGEDGPRVGIFKKNKNSKKGNGKKTD